MEGTTEDYGHLNPFYNHLVIENILKYTNRVADLKALRKTSHQYCNATSPKLLHNSVVNINSERTMQRYMKTFPNGPNHLNFHIKILQSMETNWVDSFMKYILQSAEELHLSKCVMTYPEILDILTLGRSLKTLSFNEVLIEGESNEEDLISSGTNSDTVTRLEVTTCEEGNAFPWHCVFSKLPNLEVLHAQLQSSPQVTTLLESMLDSPFKLKEFSSFLVDFDTSQVNLLNCLEFPLKSLDLSIGSSVSTLTVQDLLNSSSLKGIETLKLFHETDPEINLLVLPRLHNLKSLELMGDPVDASVLRSVITGCPNLKHLNLSQLLNSEILIKENFKHLNLKSLSIEEGFLAKEVVTKIAYIFPNLTRVCLFLNDDNVGALFRDFKIVEDIIVLGTELTDLGIIGVNPKGRSRISDCKRLRKFSLYPQPQDRITDMSIHHGLIHVPELTSVELPETAVTNEGLRALIEAKPNLVLLSARIAINPRTGEHSLRSSKYQIV